MGLTVTRSKGYGIFCLVDNWVMSFQPSLSQDHIPTFKFGNLKCQSFKVLVDGKVKGAGVCKLAISLPSINNNKGFWFRFQGKGQVVFDCKVQVDELC